MKSPASKELNRDLFNQWFAEESNKREEQIKKNHTPSLTIIATQGTLDKAYPPLILGSTAAALGWSVTIFYSFYALDVLKQNLSLKVSPLGNPAMPMKMPFGPNWLQDINWQIPNIAMSNIPGFEKAATAMMSSTMKKHGVATVEELRSLCLEADVKLVACQMTVDLFGHNKEDFIPEISDWIGAASFLPIAQSSDVTLFM